MTTLYSIHLSRHIDGFGKPSVRAMQSALAGHLRNGELVRPDVDAIRAALPHYYRKAFDRSGKGFAFHKHDDSKPAHCHLHDRRGRYMNTIYAIPYEYKAGAA